MWASQRKSSRCSDSQIMPKLWKRDSSWKIYKQQKPQSLPFKVDKKVQKTNHKNVKNRSLKKPNRFCQKFTNSKTHRYFDILEKILRFWFDHDWKPSLNQDLNHPQILLKIGTKNEKKLPNKTCKTLPNFHRNQHNFVQLRTSKSNLTYFFVRWSDSTVFSNLSKNHYWAIFTSQKFTFSTTLSSQNCKNLYSWHFQFAGNSNL